MMESRKTCNYTDEKGKECKNLRIEKKGNKFCEEHQFQIQTDIEEGDNYISQLMREEARDFKRKKKEVKK